tara:strand:+ start:660 stop:1220 length:561 start_codon:yes stop_codon:yes gene_type:complete
MSFNFSDGSVQSSASGVLEKIWVPCDGRTVTTKSGNNMSITNVTGEQTFSSSYHDMNGSVITYTPPTGTTLVIYEYAYQQKRWDTHGINHYKFQIDGTVISNSYYTLSANQQLEDLNHFKFPINIGGSTNNDTGQLASWGSSRTLVLRCRRYGGSNEARCHVTEYSDGTGTNRFHQPCVGVTAIAA